MELSNVFFNSTVDELSNGYKKIGEKYVCLICGKTFEKGIIYKEDGDYYEAEKYIRLHIEREHKGVFSYLIEMNKKYTGLTDIMKEMMLYFNQGLSDKDIAEKVGCSTSTVRNYRFKLREREKQAKIYLALMSRISFEPREEIVPIHRGATVLDERYAITNSEREDVLKKYFDSNGKLLDFPPKEKRKVIILQEIVKQFESGKFYDEKEVNKIISRIYDDYAIIRRYLIEYGFLDRKRDGSRYWLND